MRLKLIQSVMIVGCILSAAGMPAAQTLRKTAPPSTKTLAFEVGSGAKVTYTITAEEVHAMVNRIGTVSARFFSPLWSATFANRGYKFTAPRLVAFVEPIETACGIAGAGAVGYCPADNTLFYDARYLAYMGKRAAGEANTDGEYAPIVAIAHEYGHAVQHQLGARSAIVIEGENTADCLAGVMTKVVAVAGSLDEGNLREGLYMLAQAGDPTTTKIWNIGHGSAEERIGNFMNGYKHGIAACGDQVAQYLLKYAKLDN